MTINVLYRTKATATGGRAGTVKSEDGTFEAQLSLPQEMGGAGGAGTNPEQLFAAGYSACFGSAVQFVAGQQKTKIGNVEVQAEVGVGTREAGGFGLTVSLKAIIDGVDQATAEALVAEAHKVCPYSNATRGNVDVQVSAAAR